MARVSVVIPAFNAEATLPAAVESVLAQTYRDVEVLVVDDGSSDRTSDVAQRFGEPVSCVRTENRGVSEARNTGIAASSAELVALLDADDVWEPTKLERQLEVLDARPSAGVCTTGSLRVDPELRPLEVTRAVVPADACETLLLRSMALGSLSSPLIRRDVLNAVGGFDPRLSQCADWDYFIRLSQCTEFAVIPDPLVRYRISPGSMSSDIGMLERETFAVLDRFFASPAAEPYQPLRRRCYSNHWIILSGSYLHKRQPRSALRCLTKGVLVHPAGVRRPLGAPGRWLRRAARLASPTREVGS